jgi:hypothetical protein
MDIIEATSIIIGKTVALFSINIKEMLTKNGIVLDANLYNTEQLIDAVFTGLDSSPSFLKDFSDFVKLNKDLL